MISYQILAPVSLVQIAQQLISEYGKLGDIAVDATLGNGHDTVFLAELVGSEGKVYGFDLQLTAIRNTLVKLLHAGVDQQVVLHQYNHADMQQLISESKVNVFMFNLGYLPGADKSLITQTDSTLKALNSAVKLLADNGAISIIAYPGHPGGKEETAAVTNWYQTLDPWVYHIDVIRLQQKNSVPPELIFIHKDCA